MKKIAFRPQTIDHAAFADNAERCFEEQSRRWRAELAIPPEKKVLLALDCDAKDLDILLESFQNFQESDAGHEHYLLLPGKKEGGRGVRFIPPAERPVLPVYHRLGDIAIAVARKTQPWNPGVNMAMACSRPVLITENICGAGNLVTPPSNGWTVDSAHPELWFDYLKAADQEQLRRMGEAARKSIEEWNAGERLSQF